jgi:outer membrane lipopolysaccharide assembly protein LptE/RlpB
MTRIVSFIAVACVALMGTGCGYTLRGSGSVLPSDVKNIYIPRVENGSTELGLADVVTDALRDEFDSYGTVSVVEKQGEADAILKVRIIDVKNSTSTVNVATNTSLQMDATMLLGGELRRTTGQILWRENNLKVTKEYAANQSVVVTTSPDFASGSISASDLASLSSRDISRGQEAQALNDLASNAARMIYDKSVAPDF